jgi:hypothetical protein
MASSRVKFTFTFYCVLDEILGELAERYQCIISRIEKVSPKLWFLSTTLTQHNILEECGLNTRHHHPVPHWNTVSLFQLMFPDLQSI